MKYAYLPIIAACAVLASCKGEKSGGSSTSASAGSDTYVLAKADFKPAAGTKITKSKKMAMKDGKVNIVMGEQKIDGTANMTETETEVMEIVSAEKVKMQVTEGEKKQVMKIGGQDQGGPAEPPALLKTPYTLTKSGGTWTAALDDGATPTPEQKKELTKKEKSMSKDEDAAMYGTSPRKVGETWTVDAANLPFAEGDKDTKGQVKLTFKGVETYEGKKCARIEGPMELTGKTEEGKGPDMSLKGDVVVLRSIDDMTDLKMEFKGKMEMHGDLPGGGKMDMSGDMTMEGNGKVSH